MALAYGGKIHTVSSAHQIRGALVFNITPRKVVTFAGYSGAGYEDNDYVANVTTGILSSLNPHDTIINAGATIDGIGVVYELARAHDFITIGIVSSLARNDAVIAPHVNHVFFVDDDTWGGYLPGSDKLSPVSRVMVDISDAMFCIGGGQIARDEFIEMGKAGKFRRFYSADMNHQKAIEAAKRKGLDVPESFMGSVGDCFAVNVDAFLM